ncbi:hypothetical protein LIS04_151 [Listeria phage LIS04]|nr:hypothetical protein LIS04_151 [Listeria phage LIS04]
MTKMKSLVERIKTEVQLLDPSDKSSDVEDALIEVAYILEKYDLNEGESALLMTMLDRSTKEKPLSPLTGDDSEWTKVNDLIEINHRAPSVIRYVGSTEATDNSALLVQDELGHWGYKDVEVKFPYMPPTVPRKEGIDDEVKVTSMTDILNK